MNSHIKMRVKSRRHTENERPAVPRERFSSREFLGSLRHDCERSRNFVNKVFSIGNVSIDLFRRTSARAHANLHRDCIVSLQGYMFFFACSWKTAGLFHGRDSSKSGKSHLFQECSSYLLFIIFLNTLISGR